MTPLELILSEIPDFVKRRSLGERRKAPPTKKSGKFLKVKLWSIFTTSLELILSEIPDTDQCRACGAVQNRNGSRAKNFLP